MADKFDCVVIGGGPGGYAAAIRCAQKGGNVGLVEKGEMGGTCLNRGCIPSKALLGSVEFLNKAKHSSLMGLDIEGHVKPNWKKIQSRKDSIVKGFNNGVTGLLKSNGVKIFEGKGIIKQHGTVEVRGENGSQQLETGNIIIATGSEPIEIPAFKFDGETIISSEEALSLDEVPESMVIIGGGVIGCEMGCVYASVGTEVTIVEALDRLLPGEDEWVGKLLAKEFKKLGIKSQTSQKVTGVESGGEKAVVNIEGQDSIRADKVLVSVGRKAVCDKETIDNVGLEMDGSVIKVNKKMETNIDGVYAIGDVVGTTFLAHGAFAEAEVAAANVMDEDKQMGDYDLIPRAVYSFPEVASVGKNEIQCEKEGIECEVGKANFRTNGRSVAHNENVGEVRVIKSKSSGKIKGVTMAGAEVTELIASARALIGSREEITDVSFPHPTVSEVLKEAWEDAYGLSIHVPPRKMKK